MLLGRNGAGKTTTLRTIMGLWRASAGAIRFDGARHHRARDARHRAPRHRLRARDHGHLRRPHGAREPGARGAQRPARRDSGSTGSSRFFPALKKFWELPAGNLSGGQKQMLSIARAIVEPRKLMLIDEPTKGLAPAIIANLIAAFRELKDRDDDPAGRAELRLRAKARRHGRGDGRRRIVHTGGMAALAADRRAAAAAARPSHGGAPVRGRAFDWPVAAARLDPPLLMPALARRVAADRLSVDLGDAHRRRPRHGPDDLHHGLGPDARLRPHGRAQFRPRRLHRRRRLRGGDASCWRSAPWMRPTSLGSTSAALLPALLAAMVVTRRCSAASSSA